VRWRAKNTFEIQPNFLSTLHFAKCERRTENGMLAVEWRRTEDGVVLKIQTAGDVTAIYKADKIYNKETTFLIE
jgi:hypothetical protein